MSRGERVISTLARISSSLATAAGPAPAAALQCLDQPQQPHQVHQAFPLHAAAPTAMWRGGAPTTATTRGGAPFGGAAASSHHLRPPLHPQPQLHHPHHPHHPLLPLQARGVATAATSSGGGARHPTPSSALFSALLLPPTPLAPSSPTARAARLAAFAAHATDPASPPQPPPLAAPPLPAGARLYLRPTGTGSCDHIGEKLPLPPAIPLAEGTVYEVGRAEPSDIVLPIPTVSTRHALLRVDGGGRVSVTDLNSTNGTAVNGVELTAGSDGATAEVPLGGEVVFGDSYLARFQLEAVVLSSGQQQGQQQGEEYPSSSSSGGR